MYYILTNSSGDVVGIYNGSGTLLASYEYDAWGNCKITKDTNGIGELNPIRYRGYYYDTETGLYYLQSRYYNANVGRFLNADDRLSSSTELIGLNLFSYCGNNAVNRIDSTGHCWTAILIASLCIIAVTKIVCTIKELDRVNSEFNSLPNPTTNITESFTETLRTNAETVKTTTKTEGIIKSSVQFYHKVRNKGDWDLKQKAEYQGTFQFNDKTVQAQDIGNINFGYAGKALGLPDGILLAGAGCAQILAGTSTFSFLVVSNGDDLRDQMYIMYGIQLYKEAQKNE